MPLGDVESRPSATATDLQKTAACAVRQHVAKGLRLLDGREAVQAYFMPKNGALDPPRHLASVLRVLFPETVERIWFGHSSHDTWVSRGIAGWF